MNKLIGKIVITGKIKLLTGLHIGTSGDFSAIGAVDNIVIRDAVTNRPIIPGSSLKGKLRYLLARTKYDGSLKLEKIENESNEINRLFGGSKPVVISRLQFQDLFLNEESAKELDNADLDLPFTEIKYENTIDRSDSTANPRQQERVPAGSVFDLKLVYNVEDKDESIIDFTNILQAFEILEDDYLGGHGTRGYGRVKFEELKIEKRVYDDSYSENMTEVESYFTEILNESNVTVSN